MLILVPVAVFIAAYLGTAVVRRLARRYGWVAPPRHDRWHTQPTALHGGLGFYPAFLAGALWLLVDKYHVAALWAGEITSIPRDVLLAVAMLTGSLVMVTLGFWDDLKSFRPATKLLFQLIATSVFVYMGGVFPLTGF